MPQPTTRPSKKSASPSRRTWFFFWNQVAEPPTAREFLEASEGSLPAAAAETAAESALEARPPLAVEMMRFCLLGRETRAKALVLPKS